MQTVPTSVKTMDELNAWIATVDGADLAARTFLADTSGLKVRNKNGFTLTNGIVQAGGSLGGKALVDVLGCNGFRAEGIRALGVNPSGGSALYPSGKEPNHGFRIGTGTGIELSSCDVEDVYGDFYYCNEAKNVYIHGGTAKRNSRHAFTVVDGYDVRFEDNSLYDVYGNVVDIENATRLASVINKIAVRNNCIKKHRLLFLGLTCGTVDDLDLSGNTFFGSFMNVFAKSGSGVRSGFKMVGNHSDTVRKSTTPLVEMYYWGDIYIYNNVQPLVMQLKGGVTRQVLELNHCGTQLTEPNTWA